MSEWDVMAPYYDLLFKDRTFDIPFWVTSAKQFGSSILELTCGTGRITIPIVRAGIEVTGLDISRSMIAVAKQKKNELPRFEQQRVHFDFGNVTDFSFPRNTFQAVFSPWGFVPVTRMEQDGIFRSIKQVLSPMGYVVIDIENNKEPEEDWNIVRLKEYVALPDRGLTLIRQANNTGSAATKVGRIVYTLDIVRKNGLMKRLITERIYRIYTIQDLKSLLIINGFRIAAVYGDYDFSPWSPKSNRVIVVAQLSRKHYWSSMINRISAVLH